ncbi:HAD family hydrolase, partial [Eubacterium sp.]|uniref:HAD family hydrolase n=1 Tax=Eubacterium sp. TaxID=142586 RepID=UPI003F071773
GFESVNSKFNLSLSNEEIEKSVEIIKSYNPRVNYREKEIEPCDIFKDAISHWNIEIEINRVIESFFEGIRLDAVIYDYAFDLIDSYKQDGYFVACLTDLPSGMPDYIFKKPLQMLIDKLDLYVSSQSCGYRKPNKFGLQYIADYFDVDVKSLLFIGDEKKDKLAAQNADCEFKCINELLLKKF